jgi:tRNA A-37 threonylcarbamoyl transferase component Bud32
MLQEGTQIGKYRIVRKIGAGGMADVYQAQDSVMGRQVALKVLPPELSRDPERAARFEKEVRSLASLEHPGIVTIYDVGQDNGCHYYTMALLTGQDLKQKIEEGIAPEQAIAIIRKIAHVLEFAHSKGFVHRDIKPENIMFDQKGTPLLTDFGIARAVETGTRMTATGMSIGTPHYMSPEQARGEEAGPASDFYSLGVVLYECLCAKVPFAGENSTAIGIKHIQNAPDPLPAHLSSLQPLMDGLLAKDPAGRFASAAQVERALGMVFTGQQPERKGAAGSSKAKYLWAMGGVLLAFLAAGGYWFFQQEGAGLQAFLGNPTKQQVAQPASEAGPEEEEGKAANGEDSKDKAEKDGSAAGAPAVEAPPAEAVPAEVTDAEKIKRMREASPEPWLDIAVPQTPMAPNLYLNRIVPSGLLRWSLYGRYIDGYQRLENNGFRISIPFKKEFSRRRKTAHFEVVGRMVQGDIGRVFGYLMLFPPEEEGRPQDSFVREVSVVPFPFDLFFTDDRIIDAILRIPTLRINHWEVNAGTVSVSDLGLTGFGPKGRVKVQSANLSLGDGYDDKLVVSSLRAISDFKKEGILAGTTLDVQYEGMEFLDGENLVWQAGQGRITLKQGLSGEKGLRFDISGSLDRFWLDPGAGQDIEAEDFSAKITAKASDRSLVSDIVEMYITFWLADLGWLPLDRREKYYAMDQANLRGLQILSSGSGIPSSSLKFKMDSKDFLFGGSLAWGHGINQLSAQYHGIGEEEFFRFAKVDTRIKGDLAMLRNWQLPSELGDFIDHLAEAEWIAPSPDGTVEIPVEIRQNRFYVDGKDLRRLE